ncbi:MAG TPA: peptidoglycan editing factor PgeF, partial [Nitrospirae bacterium]|nr:peptidoglycan editing factor PgeF [Nitrospirota bacterium]
KAFFSTSSFDHKPDNIAKTVNISKKNVYLPLQKHTSYVHILDKDMTPVIADAVVTGIKGILIGVQVADCVPILLYDRQRNVIGAVHAGWKGTAAGILKKTISVMQREFNSSTWDILMAAGPSIRQCCYNVGADVGDAVDSATGKGDYYVKRDSLRFIDLSSANVKQALSAGIPGENVWQSEECTFCDPDRFHSYRYAKDKAGRQGGFIMLE